MFPRNRLADHGLDILRHDAPHGCVDHVLLAFPLAVAIIPVWLTFASIGAWGKWIIPAMAFLTLVLYWAFQLRIMQSALHLAGTKWLESAPDVVDGTASPKRAVHAGVRAVLQHHLWYVVSISMALTSLSLVITVYNYFWTEDRGLLRYVGVIHSGYVGSILAQFGYHVPLPFMEWPATLLLAAIMLLLFSAANSLLSASLALCTHRLGRTLLLRGLMVLIAFGAFYSLFSLRNTPEWTCHRNGMIPIRCTDMLFRLRVVDSLQALLLSFADGGAALSTGMHLPMGVNPSWEGYQWRHLLVGMMTLLCQLALSGLILRIAYRVDGAASIA